MNYLFQHGLIFQHDIYNESEQRCTTEVHQVCIATASWWYTPTLSLPHRWVCHSGGFDPSGCPPHSRLPGYWLPVIIRSRNWWSAKQCSIAATGFVCVCMITNMTLNNCTSAIPWHSTIKWILAMITVPDECKQVHMPTQTDPVCATVTELMMRRCWISNVEERGSDQIISSPALVGRLIRM